MQVTKLEIKDFGKFTDNRVIDNIGPRIALFYGRNEAGKTTIFNMIKVMMYGFFPAKAQAHPYSSWNNGKIEFTAYLEALDGDEIIVHRKLLSRPQGKYIAGEDIINLKNEPLPINSHVSQEIYDKIYSLRVEDLIEIQGKAWEEIENKLLAGYGTDLIKNTRDVLKDIKGEYEKIWRESGRGKYLVKELENEIRELKKLKKEAYMKEEEIRRMDERINDIDIKIRELKEEKIRLKTLLSKGKELAPIRKNLEQLRENRKKLIMDDLSLSIPYDIRNRRREITENLQEITDDKNRKRQMLDERIAEKYILSPMDKLILENKGKINALSKKYTRIKSLEENISRVKYNIEKLKDRLSHEADNFLTEKWNSRIKERFEEINKSELKILVSNYKNTSNVLNEVRLKRDMKITSDVKLNLSKVYIFSLILALLLAVLGFMMDKDILKLVSFGALIYGLTGVMNYGSMKRVIKKNYKRNGLEELKDEINKLEDRLQRDKESLTSYLMGIPVSDLMIENIDEMLVVGLIKIKDMVYELNELVMDFDSFSKEYQEEREELDDFLYQFSWEAFINEDEKIFLLKDRLEELEKKVVINKSIEKEIVELERNIKDIDKKERQIRNIIEDYEAKLNQIGDGDIEKGLDIVENNYRLRAKIGSIMEELKGRPDIDILVKEIKEYEEFDKWIFSDYEVLKAEDEFEEINQKLKDFEVERARLEETINKLSQSIGLDEIESRLKILEDDLERSSTKRDKLALLSEVIKFADQKFKEENRPDVLKNAGKYFKLITNSRYTDVFIDEDDEGNTIMVKEAGEVIPKRVTDTFSKGTLNQLYLALRLSLIDYLDKDKETLPICFDELLVNWDEPRLNSSLRLLEEISKRRQIFIFTCHDWMAEKIESFFNVKRITL